MFQSLNIKSKEAELVRTIRELYKTSEEVGTMMPNLDSPAKGVFLNHLSKASLKFGFIFYNGRI